MDNFIWIINIYMIKLTIKYALFALIATILNLATQRVIDTFYQGFLAYWVSLGFGTLIGLAIKYVLDKKYIFAYIAKNKADDAKKFVLYIFMGVFTTLIFWGFQTLFFTLWGNDAKFLGAIIGLSIGYFTKYQLDKRFVFKKL